LSAATFFWSSGPTLRGGRRALASGHSAIRADGAEPSSQRRFRSPAGSFAGSSRRTVHAAMTGLRMGLFETLDTAVCLAAEGEAVSGLS
jgi:hypothetical protein